MTLETVGRIEFRANRLGWVSALMMVVCKQISPVVALSQLENLIELTGILSTNVWEL